MPSFSLFYIFVFLFFYFIFFILFYFFLLGIVGFVLRCRSNGNLISWLKRGSMYRIVGHQVNTVLYNMSTTLSTLRYMYPSDDPW